MVGVRGQTAMLELDEPVILVPEVDGKALVGPPGRLHESCHPISLSSSRLRTCIATVAPAAPCMVLVPSVGLRFVGPSGWHSQPHLYGLCVTCGVCALRHSWPCITGT